MQAQKIGNLRISRRQTLRQGRRDGEPREVLHQAVVRGPQAERHAVQIVDMFPGCVVVQALAAAHGLARSRECARRAEGHEHIQGRQRRDGASRGDAAGEELEESLDGALEHAVCLGDAGADGDAYKVRCCEAADGSTGWVDAAGLCKYQKLITGSRGWPGRTCTYIPSSLAACFTLSTVLGGILKLRVKFTCRFESTPRSKDGL